MRPLTTNLVHVTVAHAAVLDINFDIFGARGASGELDDLMTGVYTKRGKRR